MSDRVDLFRSRSLGALDHLELDPLALAQGLEPVHFDRGMMHEDILRAIIEADESETLRIVEPLHCTLSGGKNGSGGGTRTPRQGT